MTDAEMLKFAIENGIIDAAYVQKEIEMRKRQEILDAHPYEIWEGKNKKWYTYIPDEKKGRRLKKRNTKGQIQDAIVDYWREREENPTIKEIYKEWITGKLEREEISESTCDRYNRQYDESMTEFGKKRMRDVSEYDVETFVLDSIHKNNLTSKGYSNLRTLLYGIFKMAKKRKFISFSIVEVIGDIEISKKSFRKVIKSDEEMVFMEDELPVVNDYLMKNRDIINLGLLLIFKSGVRVGELSAIKKEDITGNVIHINRTEVSYKGDGGEMIYEVRDFPKTEAGIRDAIIPHRYMWIMEEIFQKNPYGEYFFEVRGRRIRTYVFRNRLYTVCKKSNVVKKSPHKIRKTYGSILIDSGTADSLIISQMGHTDIRTTRNHYYKNRKDQSQKIIAIDSVAGL